VGGWNVDKEDGWRLEGNNGLVGHRGNGGCEDAADPDEVGSNPVGEREARRQ
jgi:hypothetical protein